MTNKEQTGRLGLADIIGQKDAVAGLRGVIAAARNRGVFLDHILILGDEGMGKATIADAVAAECGTVLHTPTAEQRGDQEKFFQYIANMKPGQLFFLERFEKLPKTVRDIAAGCIHDQPVPVVIGKGSTSQTFREAVPRATVIATARKLTTQLSDLFERAFVFELDSYEPQYLAEVVLLAARRGGIAVPRGGAKSIAEECDGTPADAVTLYRRVARLANAEPGSSLSAAEVKKYLDLVLAAEAGE
jgi:Holliday junction resolvasome RuvABC ATP-dependent DNA helicase subunit